MIDLINLTSKYRVKLILKIYKKWLKKGCKVLDVGCGDGLVSSELQKKLIIDITGCDLMSYLKRDIKFVKMVDKNKLPFKKNSYDVAMFNDMLHHTSWINQVNILKEGLRVAKEVLIFEVKPDILARVTDYLINKIHNPYMNVPFTFRSVSDWEILFNKLKVSFEYVAIKRPIFYPVSHIAFRIKLKTRKL